MAEKKFFESPKKRHYGLTLIAILGIIGALFLLLAGIGVSALGGFLSFLIPTLGGMTVALGAGIAIGAIVLLILYIGLLQESKWPYRIIYGLFLIAFALTAISLFIPPYTAIGIGVGLIVLLIYGIFVWYFRRIANEVDPALCKSGAKALCKRKMN